MITSNVKASAGRTADGGFRYLLHGILNLCHTASNSMMQVLGFASKQLVIFVIFQNLFLSNTEYFFTHFQSSCLQRNDFCLSVKTDLLIMQT